MSFPKVPEKILSFSEKFNLPMIPPGKQSDFQAASFFIFSLTPPEGLCYQKIKSLWALEA
jgi:hypothetical protein